jgi:ribonuclease HI
MVNKRRGAKRPSEEALEAAAALERLVREPVLGLKAEDLGTLRAAAEILKAAFASRSTGTERQDTGSQAAVPVGAEAGQAAGGVASEAVLWSDGASRGNPGKAGIGAILKAKDGSVLGRLAEYIGEATNNVAEYKAVIAGLEEAARLGVKRLEVRADSLLVIEQLKGNYAVKNQTLKGLHAQALRRAAVFEHVSYRHVPRGENSEADALANQGIDFC